MYVLFIHTRRRKDISREKITLFLVFLRIFAENLEEKEQENTNLENRYVRFY